MSYRIRRLRFVVRGVNDLYREAADNLALRGDLDAAKRQIYLFIDKINDLLAPDALRKVLPTDDPFRDTALVELLARDSDADPQTVATENGPTLTAMMAALSDYLGERLRERPSRDARAVQRAVRAVGRAAEQRRTHALHRLPAVGHRDLPAPVAERDPAVQSHPGRPLQSGRCAPFHHRRKPQSQGIGFHHFAAFSPLGQGRGLSRRCLDGAEQLLHLLGLEDDAGDAIYRSILDEEANTLQTAADQIKACRDKLSSHTT